MAGVAHYDVVKHFDFEKLPGAYQVACNLHVGFGWRCLAARVIVREHKGSGSGHNCQPKYFAGVNQDRVLCADTDQIMPFDAAAGIQHQNNEAFTLRVQRRSRLHLIVLRLYGGFASPILFIHGLGANLSTRMIESDLAAAGCSIVWRTAKLPIF
jgi:hypothetical protein